MIADGHHRFAAARANDAAGAGCGHDAILALITPMGPGGLRVDAIHRVVPEVDLDAAVTEPPVGLPGPPSAGHRRHDRRRSVARWLAGEDPGELSSSPTAADWSGCVPVHRGAGDRAVQAPPVWRGLDVVLAHHGLLACCGTVGTTRSRYSSRIASRRRSRLAEERAGVALLLRAPPSPGDVAAVARAGARMPRKSTLFVPKPRTGLVLRPLDELEFSAYSPVLPSTDSRMRSAWPLCRAYSSIMWQTIQRKLGARPSGQVRISVEVDVAGGQRTFQRTARETDGLLPEGPQLLR